MALHSNRRIHSLVITAHQRIFAGLIDSACLIALVVWSPFMPLLASAHTHDLTYLRHYGASVRQALRHAQAMRRAQVLSRNLMRTRYEVAHTYVTGECTHCGRCCTFNACVFLEQRDDGRTQCAIYGTRFFKLLSCGDYPMTAEDIAVYDCPSFYATQRDASGAQRVIRIYPND